MKVRVRLLKFTLPTGETEVLLTTLCDKQQYPASEFYQVYGWRWGNETYYDRLKNVFEVERFSGISPHVIEQDFYAIVFLTTLESVLTKSAQETLDQRDRHKRSDFVGRRVWRAAMWPADTSHSRVKSTSSISSRSLRISWPLSSSSRKISLRI
jgi:hypothetical protein